MSFVAIFRFVILPMFLFSGTFFPVEELPAPLEVIAYFTPLYHGVELCRSLTLGTAELAARARPPRVPASRSPASGSRPRT